MSDFIKKAFFNIIVTMSSVIVFVVLMIYWAFKRLFEIPFYFDCAVEDNLISSISDMKELIFNDVLPFFDNYSTMSDLENVYITRYKKSTLTDLKGVYTVFCNAIFYIGENKYKEAKKELEQIVLSREKYLQINNNHLRMYKEARNDPKDYFHKSAESEIEYYQIYLKMYDMYFPIVEELYKMVDQDVEIQEWYLNQIKKAKENINKKDFFLS